VIIAGWYERVIARATAQLIKAITAAQNVSSSITPQGVV